MGIKLTGFSGIADVLGKHRNVAFADDSLVIGDLTIDEAKAIVRQVGEVEKAAPPAESKAPAKKEKVVVDKDVTEKQKERKSRRGKSKAKAAEEEPPPKRVRVPEEEDEDDEQDVDDDDGLDEQNGGEGGLPEVVRRATKLFDVLKYFAGTDGVTDADGLHELCEQHREEIGILGRIDPDNLRERIARTLQVRSLD